jgi:uncharacterized protein (TIGR02246 family)
VPFALAITSRAQVRAAPEDDAAISAVIVEMTEAFNRHDAVGSSRMYTPDADFTNVAGMQAKGAAGIETFLASAFQSRLKAATQKTLSVTIHFIRSDVAIAHVTNQISGFLNADGSVAPPHEELSLRVFEKDNGIWRVSAFHNTTIAASLKRN